MSRHRVKTPGKDEGVGDDPLPDLVRRLIKAEEDLENSVAGQIDSVVRPDGDAYLLRNAREKLRLSETRQREQAAIQLKILNALPAHIALLDEQGAVIAVNEAWRRFATANAMSGSDFGIGRNYLETCDRAHGDCSEEAMQVADGIRSVMSGQAQQFSLEYPCHGPGEQRWFRLMVTALEEQGPGGVVVMHVNITERKQVELALQDSEARFRELAENINEVFYNHDPHALCMSYISPTYEEVWGRSCESLMADALSYMEAILPEDRPLAMGARDRFMKGEVTDTEYRIRRPDGSIRWIRDISYPVLNAEGRVERIVGTARDVTERKHWEFEVARTNRALHLLSACNEALVRATDEDQLLNDICRLIVEIGGSRMAWVGFAKMDEAKTIRPVAHAGFEDGYLAGISLSWSEHDSRGNGPAGRSIRERKPVVCADIASEFAGTYWVEDAIRRGYRSIVSLPLRMEERTFGLLALYSSEVGPPTEGELKLLQELANNLAFGIESIRIRRERQQADAKMREQASLLDNSHEAIWVRGLDHRVTYWNKGAERLYGWMAEEVMGRPIEELIYGEHLETFQTINALLLETGKWSGEVRHVTKDGKECIVEGRASLILDGEGRPQGILAINTDITERKKIESQFLRAQRMESIGTLAGGIAHDLNNVLAPIMMSIGLLRMTVRDEGDRRILDTIESSAKRGADMVRQVLSFARGVEGQKVPTPPRHLIAEIERIIRETFPKSIQLEVKASRNVRAISCDPTQMHQVLLNLCVNARDAMPMGGTLTLSAENVMLDAQYVMVNRAGRPGPHVMFRVADTGDGIPAEMRDRIFDPFFTTKQPGHGTGLGLSTVATIVKGHEGFIQFYSEPERGTTFKVYLPAESGDKSASAPPMLEDPPRANGETVLVVDDEEPVRVVTRQTLEAFGYRVLLAENGADAIAIYARQTGDIALVLTDMMMPIMDGPTTINALLKINPNVRIIGASGLSSSGSSLKAFGASTKFFLLKPYTAETLLKTVHQALSE